MELRALLADAAAELAAAGVESARNDAELLLAHVLNCSRGELLTKSEVSDAQAAAFHALVAQRCARIPLQHITGRAAFRHLEIAVGPGVLIPRPETELVVEAALRFIAANRVGRVKVVDLCSGSAAMTASLAIEAGDADVFGLEFEPDAFGWGRRTVQDLAKAISAAGSQVELRQGDVRGCAERELRDLRGCCDVVVSNPPYIPTWAVPRDPEVATHEPAAALYGGADGMEFVGAVADAAAALLKAGGLLVIEHGDVQGEAGEVSVPRTLRAHGSFIEVADQLDLAGRPRYTTAVRA